MRSTPKCPRITKHYRSSESGQVLILIGIIVVAFVLIFMWYANTVIARPTPTPYTNVFWAWLHGVFAVPSFILSLFDNKVAIYQSPNSGGWYDFGFLVGVGAIFKASTSSSRH